MTKAKISGTVDQSLLDACDELARIVENIAHGDASLLGLSGTDQRLTFEQTAARRGIVASGVPWARSRAIRSENHSQALLASGWVDRLGAERAGADLPRERSLGRVVEVEGRRAR